MRTRLCFGTARVILLMGFVATAQAAENQGVREVMDLTGQWGFRTDMGRDGEKHGWHTWKQDTGTWRQVQVPIAFDDCAPGMKGYRGVCWFQKKVRVPQSWLGRRIGLRFEGVNNAAQVYVNDQWVGENKAYCLPFELPVEGLLRYGRDNLVVVRVSSESQQLPTAFYWREDSGILREVKLIASDPCRLANLRIVAEPQGQGGSFSLRAFVENGDKNPREGALTVELRDRDGRGVATFASAATQLAAGAVTELVAAGRVPEVAPWSPEQPALYTAETTLRSASGICDRLSTRFGFRKIEVQGAKLLLNGKPIFLTGFNRPFGIVSRDRRHKFKVYAVVQKRFAELQKIHAAGAGDRSAKVSRDAE